ncbi:MAG: bifunctional UDP-N-acetylglucosamine diphosphorylase/glucosamine-1-phosphate N-acetyltransferase GlmU [Clostridiales bacterium]|jgi:bifunctional UDP-N-acetylglucosamine pyrophosphorylase/glucosamine-1-phosphate N-acetyltransferase|nr:bifunctional UDP-N-acetylglucosamine diphosphorylase/glucosamine-1-phosphate N-acetyltransferase GlmU [Clostridiales bacterium]
MLNILILAAGDSTRMKSKTPKVLHKVCGKEIINWVIDAASGVCADKLSPNNITIVIGNKADVVKEHISASYLNKSIAYAHQTERKGTAHAVMCAKDSLLEQGDTLILAGDAPLITSKTLSNAYMAHKNSGAAITVLTANIKHPTGYGRIIKHNNNDISVQKIVEEKDANAQEREICEVNSGMYFFDTNFLCQALQQISTDNAAGEYYLTDMIAVANQSDKKVNSYKIDDIDEIRGINDRQQLSQASKIAQKKIIRRHMRNGVTFISPADTFVSPDVTIGQDTIIYPQCILQKGTTIGEDCIIIKSRISNSHICNGCEVESSTIVDSQLNNNIKVGPFAYIRPGCNIEDNAKIGDFVEVKNSNIGAGTKLPHLTYVGDADVGSGVNFGCGSIVVNYDGKDKHRSKVGNNVFVGCNTNLVSPVDVGDGAFIAAGSTITKNVPDNTLAIARARQEIKTGWRDKRKIEN